VFFKVIVACGHVGNKKHIEVTRYFQADNAIEAWESAMIMPRAKKQRRSRCVLKVEEISLLQYLNGKTEELKNPYLQVFKNKKKIAI
jgi:hypothetical protein